MKKLFLTIFTVTAFLMVFAQKKGKNAQSESKSALSEASVSALKFRSVGPALTSGRISDFAMHPQNPKTYYIAVASGGVWKTENAGTTFEPIFDGQDSYSTACVTLDPQNPNVVWVGTGENNNQRSVAYGDGVYKSEDGGKSWKNMGLKNSEHIGNIIVHPENSDVVYVSAIGPLWSEGGDRGLYKTTDGGENWEAILTVNEHTGINEVVMDPRNPDVMYASAHQRRRHVFTYVGGGPNSAIYKTTDGGASWEKVNKGLPSVDLGRIGLAIAPSNPDVLYAIVEAAQGKGGFFRSTDGAASWQKQSSYATSGNYYQEIVVDPLNPDKIFSMNTYLHHSVDGGKTFERTGEETKHVDNHCMWIDPTDTDHFLVGCDGGIYETWDHAQTWHYKPNLPITQFYKVAVDNDFPFYNIYGGTQDNYSMGGPARTTSANGIPNSDWFVTHGGDGFESQVDPENPDIVYAQSQYGVLVRYDRKSGEELGIQPQPRKGEDAYRWNWDAPLQVSAHKSGRVYFAANKVFRSDDYGNSWEVISDDLTQQIDRNRLKVMGKVQSFEAVMKNGSTSPFGTIVAFSESPLNESLLYAGTDDGLVQVTEDGGKNWRKIQNIPGVPDMTYVNMVLASQHDENVVYAAFNHHKYGDFKPYLFKSTDKGQTWQPMANNLPERGSVYAIAEDHVTPDLLFVGTEFGVFFSPNSGQEWKQLKAGLPTIAVRDIAIQQRDHDLVLGTFGRGFYVLDDYSPLRQLTEQTLASDAALFAVRDAWVYEPSSPIGGSGKGYQGDNYYTGENLAPVALFTYYLKEGYTSPESERRKAEKQAEDAYYPSYEALKAEKEAYEPELVFTIKDAEGNTVKQMSKGMSKGMHRIHWKLRYDTQAPISLRSRGSSNPFSSRGEGPLVAPGEYSVTLSKWDGETLTQLAEPVKFKVKALPNAVMPADDREALAAFQKKADALSASLRATYQVLSDVEERLKHIKKAVAKTDGQFGELMKETIQLEHKVEDLQEAIGGDRLKSTLDMDAPPSISSRIGFMMYELSGTTAAPTKTHQRVYEIAKEELKPVIEAAQKLVTDELKALEDKLEEAGAPYTPSRLPKLLED